MDTIQKCDDCGGYYRQKEYAGVYGICDSCLKERAERAKVAHEHCKRRLKGVKTTCYHCNGKGSIHGLECPQCDGKGEKPIVIEPGASFGPDW